MQYQKKYNEWLNNSLIDQATKQELLSLQLNSKEIQDRFYKDLEFGTGGLRGIMGAGTNRINQYTIGKATQGYANYLKDKFNTDKLSNRGIAIAYDTRNNSQFLSQITANVLSSNGIKVYLSTNPTPTPQLSFTIKHFNCVGGIVITASHNPKEYNGYKIYDEFGCQIVPEIAENIIKYINKIQYISQINFDQNNDLIHKIDCTQDFVNSAITQSLLNDKTTKENLKIVYTPLHGSGNIPVRKILDQDGFKNVYVVPEQELPNGDFPTVKAPNPEEKSALNMGIELAKNIEADIVLGTDPDSDRVGIAIKTKDTYSLITGNQIGILLADYICSKKDFTKLQKPAIINTIVTNELGIKIAKEYGITSFSTLTGFKFIGEKINQFELAQQNNDDSKKFTFVFGYEESYGYLIGNHCRDKDAVVSSMLIAEMTAEYKANGKTLIDKLNEIYNKYGFYLDALDSFTLPGIDGLEKIKSIMQNLRKSPKVFDNIKQTIDYLNDISEDNNFGLLPKSDVLKFIFTDDSWIAIRPSGTEPKIKIYYSIKGKDQQHATTRLQNYQKIIKEILDIND